jgi:iron complex transport system ATP-binding protein
VTGITVDRVGFSYGAAPLFDRFDLGVAPGEFLGIIGPNGSGKSTLLRLMAGLLAPGAGRVLVGGDDIRALSRRELARRMALVPQESHFAFGFRVEEVVMMGRHPYRSRFGPPGTGDHKQVGAALSAMGVSGLRGRGIDEVSGGERQRVVIARALAQATDILLLDGVSTHLDLAHQHRVLSVLAGIHARGRTVVFVSHDLNLAAQACSRILLLDRGRTAALGTPEEVLTAGRIRSVYGVDPIIMRHPETGRPHIMLPRSGRPGNP